MILVKRVYDPVDSQDGIRFLIERLWPRGLKKAQVPMAAWVKEVAPRTDLRCWFNHDPEKWDEFKA